MYFRIYNNNYANANLYAILMRFDTYFTPYLFLRRYNNTRKIRNVRVKGGMLQCKLLLM